MAANYGRPKPVDPLWFRRDDIVHARCPCGHSRQAPLREWIMRFTLNEAMRLYEFETKLRCMRCGERRAQVSFPRSR